MTTANHPGPDSHGADPAPTDQAVRLEVRDTVLVITLDRPKANAIDTATSCALYAAFERLQTDEALRAAVLTGGGERFFSAGWDLKAAAQGEEAIDADHGPGGFAGLTELFGLDKPVIAAVNGLAMGGGFELALAADLIVADAHAEFALPEVQLGMIADSGGVLRLPRRVPRAVAAELLLTGRRLGAAEAAGWGLVTEVAEQPDTALERAVALAQRISHNAPLALAAVKEVLRETEQLSVEEGYARLRDGSLPAYRTMLTSADAEEGPRAFAERREPQWSAR